jgi:hypothetical protein
MGPRKPRSRRTATCRPSIRKAPPPGRTKPRAAQRDHFEGQDPIPKNAILLTDAYEQLVDLVVENPDRLPVFDEFWSEALQKSRESELDAGHDPDAFDEDLEEYWHRRAEANLFLRLEIEAQRLVACIRDPLTADILRLRARDWIPANWDEYIPAGIWSDHIDELNYEAPGPDGSRIHGASRPVFFVRDEFDIWLKDRLQHLSIQSQVTAKRSIDAVKEAIVAIWGSSIPAGVRAKVRERMINDWLVENGRAKASRSTIQRALKQLRSAQAIKGGVPLSVNKHRSGTRPT